MSPIRQSNRVRKPKVHWEPPPPTRRRQQPAFIIHADPSEDQLTFKDLGMQFSEDLDSESEDLDLKLKDLVSQLKDSDSQSEDLDSDTSLEDYSYQSQFLSKD